MRLRWYVESPAVSPRLDTLVLIRLLSYSGAGGDAGGPNYSGCGESYGGGGGGRSYDQQGGGGKGLIVAITTWRWTVL